ncbi:MAG: hypothetical protein NUW22_01040, partial [Acidobacteria bacterium]|nr:hypothetical protein [Acidobacteriota bacterium]
MIRPTLLSATLVVLIATSPIAAGQRGGAGAAPQTVDFIAVGADGQPVTDLTAAQIALKVGGKDRAVTSLELVRFGAAASTLPAPFATNAMSDAGRSFVLVIDEESLRPGLDATVRDALVAFEKQISVRDRLGVFTLPRGTISLGPTTDRAKFQAAVAGIQGRAKSSVTANERICHGRDALTTLASIMTSTSRQGTPTPVVYFATALAAPVQGPTSLGAALECQLTPGEFQRVGQAAEAARTQFFLVRPEETPEAGLVEGLENLTGVTGGQMLAMGSAAGGAMTRIARETASYYLATFAAEAADRNGATHRLELRTTRADVRLHTRNGVHIAKGAGGNAPTPQNMLRVADVQRGFGLRALVVTSRNDGDAKNTVKLVALAEPIDPAVKLAAAAAGVMDQAGGTKLLVWTAKPEELQRSPLAAALVVPPGTYRVRVAAVDTQGRAATVDYDLNTELASAGAAQMGGLLVGTGGTGFMPQLKFTTEPEVIVYFELYGRPTGAFGALVDIAATADGPALVEAQPTVAATPVADKFMFTAKLPIVSLKPGDYVVRAKLAFTGQPTGVLSRTIRKQ